MPELYDSLINKLNNNKSNIQNIGRSYELTAQGFAALNDKIDNTQTPIITVHHCIGYNHETNELDTSTNDYTHDQLKGLINDLQFVRLQINCLLELITATEALLGDIIKVIFNKFPEKIPSSRKIDVSTVISSDSLESLKQYVIDSFLNELAYKSPEDYIREFKKYTNIDIVESELFLIYREAKASRDIFIHNQGIVNEIYISKSGDKFRADVGQQLPINALYFLKVYGTAINLIESIEEQVNTHWSGH